MNTEPEAIDRPHRTFPTLESDGHNTFTAKAEKGWQVQDMMGMKTHEAASGVYQSAIIALGQSAERYADFASAMFAETEPRDAIEAMLIAQMSATHVAMTTLIERMSYQTQTVTRESLERSTTRLSRTYLAQMDALKRYRAKAPQAVRVERVNVESGAQAIVGNVSHVGRASDE